MSASDSKRPLVLRSFARTTAIGLAVLSATVAVVVAVGFLLLRTTGVSGLRYGGSYSPIGLAIIVAEVAAATALVVVAVVRGRGAVAVAAAFAGSSFLFWFGALFGMALDSWTSNLWLAGLSGAAAATALTISLERGRGRAAAAGAGGLVAGVLIYWAVIWIGQTLG